jgi:hypothetical protein
MSVVFPAPFGPSRPCSWPRHAMKSTSRRASRLPKRFDTLQASTAGRTTMEPHRNCTRSRRLARACNIGIASAAICPLEASLTTLEVTRPTQNLNIRGIVSAGDRSRRVAVHRPTEAERRDRGSIRRSAQNGGRTRERPDAGG